MERIVLESGKPLLIGYHTQEHRGEPYLNAPIPCTAHDAWLGIGYYFWIDIEFAHHWGHDKKRKTGHFDIYKSGIDVNNFINAVFDEEGYSFFKEKIEFAISRLRAEGHNADLQAVHRFLADKIWKNLEIQGIIYDDIPQNPPHNPNKYSDIVPLYYKKRIQLVAFELKNIYTFAPLIKKVLVNKRP